MKIITFQINPVVGDLPYNCKKIIDSIRQAKAQGAAVALFPELALCGYPPEDLLLRADFIDQMGIYLEQIVAETDGIMAVFGMARRGKGEKGLYNSAAVVADRQVLGFHDKILLPTYDIFDERRYFDSGEKVQIWKWRDKRFGVLICEDIWQHAHQVDETRYARDPVVEMELLQPDLLLNLSASPYYLDKEPLRARVVSKTAKTLNCPVVFCAQVGANDQLIFDGYSMVFNRHGELAQLADGFVEDGLTTVLGEKLLPLRIEPLHLRKEHDLYKALVMGTRDYFHKLGFKKAVIGLSGGIDSALVAAIATEALGSENVVGITMPSPFSSEGSISDSVQLAKNLGIVCKQLPIDAIFASYLTALEPHFTGKQADITEENIQARIRGMLLMAFCNKFGYLLLCTSNKSEMAVGYSTLYGDMCGALAPIGDLLKGQVYLLARFINQNREIIPLSTLKKPPSAELRPGQLDSDSLPDYETLDSAIHGLIVEQLSTQEVANKYAISEEIVRKISSMIQRAEYKRKQAAPSLRVSPRSFTAGRRHPIVERGQG